MTTLSLMMSRKQRQRSLNRPMAYPAPKGIAPSTIPTTRSSEWRMVSGRPSSSSTTRNSIARAPGVWPVLDQNETK